MLHGARHETAGTLRCENRTCHHQAKLASVAKTDPGLCRADLLEEGLRRVFQLPDDEAFDTLETCRATPRQRDPAGSRPKMSHTDEHGDSQAEGGPAEHLDHS